MIVQNDNCFEITCNKHVLISIIVPCYNCESTIRDTLNSVIAQTYKNIEIICVNDCSTDKTLEILREFESKDDRINIINNDRNLGPGKSRNIAIKKCIGDYIGFIDSDDLYAHKYVFEKVVQKITKTQALIIGGNISIFDSNSSKIIKTFSSHIDEQLKFSNKFVDFQDFQDCWYYQRFFYNTAFCRSHNIYFSESYSFQDVWFFIHAMHYAKCFFGINTNVYLYRHNEKIKMRDLKYVCDRINCIYKCLNFLKMHNYKKTISYILNYSNSYFKILQKNNIDTALYSQYQTKINNLISVSIIVPCYNCESTIRDTLNSVIAQTYKNIEIICVNDCSTDKTLEILREFESKDDRINIINNDRNLGLGSTRCIGLKNAHGDYIQFIDADDVVDLNFVLYPLKRLLQTNANICIFNYKIISNSGIRISKFAFNKEQYAKNIFLLTNPNVWNKIYDRRIIDITWGNNIRLCEDVVFTYLALLNSDNKIVYLDMPLYNYNNTNEHSLTYAKKYLIYASLLASIVVYNKIKTHYTQYTKFFEEYLQNKVKYLVTNTNDVDSFKEYIKTIFN